ncbi:MAG: hypothetical protein ABJO54_18615 [Hyphomicrobiales bacterium]
MNSETFQEGRTAACGTPGGIGKEDLLTLSFEGPVNSKTAVHFCNAA